MYALVDCNNFFVSCERVFRPNLNTRPVIVLSSNDGCDVARSNEAKALGIKMGVPLFKITDIVKKHNVECISGNLSFYGEMSRRVMSILRDMAPAIEVYSVDEAFLDLSGIPEHELKPLCQEIRKRVLKWTGIPVSIGIAPTKTLAKASASVAKKYEQAEGVYLMNSLQARRHYYYLNKETRNRVNAKALHETILFALENDNDFIKSIDLAGLTKEEIRHRYKQNLEAIIKQAVDKIVVHESKFSIFVDRVKVEGLIQGSDIDKSAEPNLYEMSIDMLFKSYEGRKCILLNGNKVSHNDVDIKRHENMVRLIVQAFQLNEKFQKSKFSTIKEFAEKVNMDRTYLGDLLKLRFLAPEIITMIFKGQSPMHLNASKLMRTKFPRCWER